MQDKIRKDWEIKILEGQRFDDVFNEINLPTRAPGITKMHLVVDTDPNSGYILESIIKAMVDWGFIDGDHEIPAVTMELQEDIDGFIIYTL